MPIPDSRRAASLTIVGAAAGTLLASAVWYLDARRREEKAARMRREMVQLLLNALSAGDPATERHCHRVADLTDSLAGAFGLKRRDRARLRVAALLHDLGKIDDQIFDVVHSSHVLSPEERAQVHRHPQESASILGPLDRAFPGVSTVVKSHHESWNGDGYPRCLRGDEIPFDARVISVADVFDALTQPRSYKKPFPVDRALAEIRKNAGTRFDPSVVAMLDRPDVVKRWREIARAGRREEQRARAEEGEEKGKGQPAR
jgi:putative nucleotidyltransferase with HDIG domain